MSQLFGRTQPVPGPLDGPREYLAPGDVGSVVELQDRYENFVGGHWIAPANGRYAIDLTPVTGEPFCEVPRSTADDVELALDAAHAAQDAWGAATLAERARVLHAVADVIEANGEMLAVAESYETGKPVRETLAVDIPLAVDHFRYFASATRMVEGSTTEVDRDTVAYHVHEPLGVVAQILPFDFPLLMAAWRLAPALGAGNCVVLKPASATPWSILKLVELFAGVVPPGVVNVVNGSGAEVGKTLATSPRVAKVVFTGETVTGRLVMQYAAQHVVPVALELGGKSPNVFFEDVAASEDAFLDRAVEGFSAFTFNKGETSASPSRALVQESIFEPFVARALERIGGIVQGDPLDTTTTLGPQVSSQQLAKIADYVEIGLAEGAECLAGGAPAAVADRLAGGYYFQPTVLKGHNSMRIFQEEIFGPVLAVTTFRDEADAVRIANDTPYGLGAGVWTRDLARAHRVARAIEAGRIWVNGYHRYPAGASFGGTKLSGIGQEAHRAALEGYSRTKSVVVSYGSAHDAEGGGP